MHGKATSIIGPRRAGKTYYFYSIISKLERKKTAYLDFEEPFLKGLNANQVLQILLEIFPEVTGNEPQNIFLDEVQNITNWESLVRSLLGRKKKVWITGPSSRLLSKEIATSLRGRTLTYTLLPFSFREYLVANRAAKKITRLKEKGKMKRMLLDYLDWGGFPEIALNKEKERILKEYLDLVFFKDFVERHKIKNTSLAEHLFNTVLQNFSTEISVRSLARKISSTKIGFDLRTLYKHMEGLDDTMVVFFLRRFSWKVHERLSWPRKVYLADNALSKPFRVGEDTRKLMENLVFLELVRKKNNQPFLDIYYLKGQNYEVDFVVKKGNKVHELIQVTNANSLEDVSKRKISSLIKGSNALNCKNLTVITMGLEEEIRKDGKIVKFVPLWKWLL